MDNDERRTDNAMDNIRNELRQAVTKINEQDHVSRHTDWSLIDEKIQKKRAVDFEKTVSRLGIPLDKCREHWASLYLLSRKWGIVSQAYKLAHPNEMDVSMQ
ncbi:hypothetical protein INT45_008268 [Circinella minor]|uniref:Uncharacterized protein n=1 Tax=Circinella minor TaxID=1195481 RepID=A0A8H7S577_9FUNG|nr:hypothetical protein INT45_008268 [Circinella minor]